MSPHVAHVWWCSVWCFKWQLWFLVNCFWLPGHDRPYHCLSWGHLRLGSLWSRATVDGDGWSVWWQQQQLHSHSHRSSIAITSCKTPTRPHTAARQCHTHITSHADLTWIHTNTHTHTVDCRWMTQWQTTIGCANVTGTPLQHCSNEKPYYFRFKTASAITI